jgi:mono/diheme cytochrome c family protein
MTTIRKSWSGSTQNAWITLFSRLSGSKINRIVYAQKPNRKRRLSMLRLGQAMFRWSSIILFACAVCLTTSSSAAGQDVAKKMTATPTRDAGLAAWQQIYSVLTHPRCINCHTATNYPQQGDDRHRHLFNIIRGPGGKGVAGLNCVTCHQGSNAESTGVPGAHNWQLAPLSMRWQDLDDKILSSAEVCRSLTDRSKNDNLSGAGLLKHHAQEPLVLWAFQPGHHRDGTARTLPPLTHKEFVAATRTWVEAGTPCPQNP